jgi:hypothetical protein
MASHPRWAFFIVPAVETSTLTICIFFALLVAFTVLLMFQTSFVFLVKGVGAHKIQKKKTVLNFV